MPEMKIRANEIEFIITMKRFKYSNCEIGRKLGVTEGAIRYRVKLLITTVFQQCFTVIN